MAIKRQRQKQTTPQTFKRVIIFVVAILLGYLVVTQVKSLRPSLSIIGHANVSYVLLGLCMLMLTFLVAALMYQLLAFHRLHFGKTVLIQVASGFANRLLPAGLGGMGLIAQYLRSQKHSTSEAITIVGMDNVIGIIGHFSLFFSVIALTNISSSAIRAPHVSWFDLLAIVGVMVLIGCIRRIREGLSSLIKHVVHDLGSYRRRPQVLLLAFCNSLLLTVLYVGILWASTRAVGAALSFPKVLVVFTAGSIIGNATPTPGGLVGTEAGLFGGFLAYGLSDGTALAAALLYRLLTYWLPILPGLVGFWVAQRRLKLID